MKHNYTIGEGPARVRAGSIAETVRLARQYVIRSDKPVPAKQARILRAQADGFDRRAIYLREEGDEPGAIRATMEAARLRKLADETENQRFPQIIA